MAAGRFSALLHCFTSSRALAETGLELGLYISFSGVLTFKNSSDLRAIAKDAPLDRVLVETDAPFLAPLRRRGAGRPALGRRRPLGAAQPAPPLFRAHRTRRRPRANAGADRRLAGSAL